MLIAYLVLTVQPSDTGSGPPDSMTVSPPKLTRMRPAVIGSTPTTCASCASISTGADEDFVATVGNGQRFCLLEAPSAFDILLKGRKLILTPLGRPGPMLSERVGLTAKKGDRSANIVPLLIRLREHEWRAGELLEIFQKIEMPEP